MYLRKNDRWKYLAAVLLSVILLMAGCGRQPAAPAAEQASEDTTEAASKADTEQAAVAEEPEKITVENALVGLCFARSETGDNEYLFRSLQDELVQRGFSEENITAQELTGRSSRQQEEIDECLAKGCSLLIIAAVDDKEIPAMADKIEAAGAGAIFVNCTPGDDEILRWTEQDIHAVWIGSTYAQELAIQMNILYDCSGTERGIDFNGDGRVGTLLVGGGEEARTVLEETLRDLGSELYVLGETDSRDPEEISSYTQEILNTHKKEAELILCSSESSAQAASDGVQLRHRLVGRDILVIGIGTHEDTCTAIINKLMSGSTFVDFYEQSKLIAVAAKDMVEGNQDKKTIADVIFKVTEENAQEVLDQLWKTRNEEESETAGTNGTGEEESADPDEDRADSESTADS
jgi:ABC-type sugar transport system substrate-binding protein